jgi:peptide/nickel transport system substrate-binding protein
MRRTAFPIVLASLLMASCADPHDDGETDVSVIGTGFTQADPDRGPLTPADRVLASATAQSLVALDSGGQVEPALAESWIVTSDGLSTIFRTRMAHWRDGSDVNGDDIARSLNRALAPDSANPIKPLLSAVDNVVGMTGRVVEVRLKTPRPNLLQLLAQPEMAIRRGREGIGPYRIDRFAHNRVRLSPVAGEDDPPGQVRDAVLLRAERPALAIARFMADRTDLVMEGTLADWPYIRAATLRPGRLRIDAVQGLFGLAVVGKNPLLGTSDVRAALAMAIDRTALAGTVGLSGWVTTESALPAQLDSAAAPTKPDWSGTSLIQRRADAASRIAAWRNGRAVPVIRVALPDGPGMRLMFARLAADWRLIGVRAQRVPLNAPDADLRLIDAVAPNSSANWYLTRLSCAAGLACDSEGDRALETSRSADTLADRSARIADADRALTKRASFIALGSPIRWALVDPSLTGWKENVLGAHPLSELRPPRSTGN